MNVPCNFILFHCLYTESFTTMIFLITYFRIILLKLKAANWYNMFSKFVVKVAVNVKFSPMPFIQWYFIYYWIFQPFHPCCFSSCRLSLWRSRLSSYKNKLALYHTRTKRDTEIFHSFDPSLPSLGSLSIAAYKLTYKLTLAYKLTITQNNI